MRLLLFLLISCQGTCFAQPDSYFLMDNYFKGNPKKVTTSTYNVVEDSLDEKTEHLVLQNSIQIDFYNPLGKCISHQWLDSNNRITSEYQFTYDDSGNRTESIYNRIDFNLRKVVSVFDNNHNEIETTDFDTMGQVISKTYFQIMSNDSMETKTMLNIDNEITSKIVSYRNEYGKIIEKVFYDKNLIIERKIYYRYNENGKLIHITNANLEGELRSISYEYDSLGREIDYRVMENRGSVAKNRQITNYVDSLKKIECIHYENGKIINSTAIFLDSNNCVLRMIDETIVYPVLMGVYEDEDLNPEPKTRVTEVRYIYDENLNWIKKIEFYNGIKYRLKIREFVY